MLKKLQISWQKAVLHFLPLGGFSSHNHVEIYHEGDVAFIRIFHAISQARFSIYLETYILAGDRLGLLLREELIKAHKRGVSVTIIYDHFGSAGLASGFLRPMADLGITILAFNPIWPWRRRGPLLFRDHRKIIVIDEKLAFCGSMNMSADYAGPIYGSNRFRDTTARVEGPAVKDLLAITKESIAEALLEKDKVDLKDLSSAPDDKHWVFTEVFLRLIGKEPQETLDPNPGTLVQVLRSNMYRHLAHIQKSMEEAVNRAVTYCFFTTPYFLPHDGLRKAIIHAKLRGVDMRVLTAGMSDVPLMRYASRHVYRGFLKQGIRIYEMTGKTLHAKIATIDGVFSSVGSYNLDHWSARRNLEVNLAIIDQEIALKLKDQFERDLELSNEINHDEFFRRSIFRRFLCWVAYLIMRI